MYSIYPLHLGTFTAMETSNLLYQVNPGEKQRRPILAYLILGGAQPILVDTGGSDEAWANKYHHGLQVPAECSLVNQLAAFNLKPTDIPIVVNTHLHWDHCFQNGLFTNATIYVQKKELQAAVTPIPTQYGYYETNIPGVQPGWMSTFGQMRVIDGEYDLTKGIRLIPLPGHTPGLQGVLVETAAGRYLITGDAIGVFENWTGNATLSHIPQGIHWSLEDYFATFAKMEKLDANVLPAHDFRVLEQKSYG